MTIISFVHTKGGAGKSTLCLLIASVLAESGSNVLIIDADSQASCSKWAARCKAAGTMPANIMVNRVSDPNGLKQLLKNGDADIILVDVQGSMNELLIAAIVASDVTLVPSKANVMEMVETVQLFEWAQSSLKRAPLRLVLTRVNGIDVRTPAFRDAVAMIRQYQLPAFATFVRERKLYEQFSSGFGALRQLETDPSKAEQVGKAHRNIVDLIADIGEMIAAESVS